MIIRSTSPDVAIPDVTITDFVLRQASRLADKPALIDGPSGRTLTYGALADLFPDQEREAAHHVGPSHQPADSRGTDVMLGVQHLGNRSQVMEPLMHPDPS